MEIILAFIPESIDIAMAGLPARFILSPSHSLRTVALSDKNLYEAYGCGYSSRIKRDSHFKDFLGKKIPPSNCKYILNHYNEQNIMEIFRQLG